MRNCRALALVALVAVLTGNCSSSSNQMGAVDGGTSSGTVTLAALAVTPPMISIAKGTAQQFKATGTYTDGSTKDLTAQAAWLSSATGVATVSAMGGKATGVGPGMSTISASVMGKTASADLTVTQAALMAITVTPATGTLAAGSTHQMTATATFADGSMQEVTDDATWSSDTESVATVNAAGLVSAVGAGNASITAALAGKMDSAVVTVSVAALSSVTVSPSTATIAKGTTAQFTATARFADGRTQDVSAQATWNAQPVAVATVGSSGLATGAGAGNATVTATFMGQTDSAALVVTEAKLVSITITPSNATITRGSTLQLTATGTYSQGPAQDLTSLVTWASDQITVATVSNAAGSRGLVSGLSPGKTGIGVLFQGVVATTVLTVTGVAPSLSQVTPDGGPAAGGSTVTLAGAGLSGATSVRFGGLSARSFNIVSDTQISAVTPAGAGKASVVVTTPNGTSNAIYYTFRPAPVLTRVDPFVGPPGGGTTVTLSGSGFSSATTVTFGTRTGTALTVVSDTQLTVVSPAGAGSVNVTVVSPNGTSGVLPFAYGSAPTVSGIIPSSGAEGGGTAVTITGSGLGNAAAVRFGSAPATSFTIVSANQIIAVSPPGVGGANITVTTGNGTSNGFPFSYRAAPAPSEVTPPAGPNAGGNTVFIVGAGLQGVTSVKFGGVEALHFTVVSDNQISVVVPPGSGNALVVVSGPLGTSAGIPYLYGPPPALGAITPSSGALPGGLTVSLTGTSFMSASSVWVDAVSVSFTVVSDGLITLVTPPGMGSVNVKVVNTFAESDTLPFSYGPAPSISTITPSSGPEFLGTTVIIAGANLTGATAVAFGSTPAISYTVDNDSQITAAVPAATGVVAVTVTTPFAASNSVNYTHLAPPTVTSFSPIIGPAPGSNSVSIIGTGFTGATGVAFGASNATSYGVSSATQIIAVAPAGSGAVPIVVTTPNGTGMSSSTYAYVPPPVLTSITTTGPETGGNAVQLVGTNFNGATAVTFGTTAASSLTVVDDMHVNAIAPAGTSTASVTITTPSGISGGLTYTWVPAPTISSISPTFGPEPGSTTVTITGTAMGGLTAVKLDTTAVTFMQVSNTQATFVTPPGTGTVAVTVTNPYGTSNSQPFVFGPVPVLGSLDRTSGSTLGAQTVVLTGSGFTMTSTVSFGSAAATSVTFDSSTQLTVVSPAGSGAQSVTVTSAYGISNPITFTYGAVPAISSLTPATGDENGGTSVLFGGTHFLGTTAVAFGSAAGTALMVTSDSALTATAPAGAGMASVTATNAYGTSAPFTFTFGPPPVVTSISPTLGTIAGGTTVTITGTNLLGGTVTFGGLAGSVLSNTATQITVTTPAHAVGNAAVVVSSQYGSGTSPTPFDYGVVPGLTSISPTSGPIGGTTSITFTGTRLDTVTSVSFGGTPATSFALGTATSLTAVAPAHAAGGVMVTVSSAYGTSGAQTYTYADAPTATSLSVVFGPTAGGTSVTVTGSGFVTGDTSVTIAGGSISSSSVTVNSPTSLTFVAPPNAAGNVAVTVTTSGGTSSGVPGGFTYEDAPTATSLTPTAGPLAGGTSVTVTGSNFTAGDTTVAIGGSTIPSGSVTVNSATSLTFSTPAHAAGNVAVTVSTSGGTSSSIAGGFTYAAAPTVTSLTPTAGPTTGGTSVTVTGANFSAGDTSVTIGGNSVSAGSVTVNSATSLTFAIPAHGAGNVAVSITTSGGTSGAVSGGFTYAASPTVTSLSATAGPTTGSTSVTITGANFSAGVTSVTIGGNVVGTGSVTVNSATSLTFSTPAHVAGNVAVTVTTSGGTSGAVPGGFTYLSAPTATSLSSVFGPIAGGSMVTITGTNFVAADTSVTIGGNVVGTGSVTVNSATSLTFSTPAHVAGNVSVTVSTSGGTSSAVSGGFTYVASPSVSSLTPVFGPSAGGTSVTITGANFVSGDTSVTIGGSSVPSGSVTVNSATSLTFTTPSGVAGNVAVSVTNSAATSSPVPGGFTYQDPPTASSLAPAFGPSAGGTSVTITGTNFVVGNTSVAIGGNTVAAGSVTVNSATSLAFTTPAHAAGNVSVAVTTSSGTSSNVSGGFSYEDAPTATSLSTAFGASAGGTSVTITGTNFVSGDTSVAIGGNTVSAGSVTVNSATSLTFTTPAHAAGNVSVAVSTSGGSSSNVSGGFTYEDAPTASSLTPTSGPLVGGTSVTVTGTNFVSGDTSVTIGGSTVSAGSVTVNSATSLTFTTPAHAAGNASVAVSTSGGTSSNVSGGFTYLNAPTATSLTPTSGTTAGGTSITITGTNFVSGGTSVTIGGNTVGAGSVTFNSATSVTFATPAHAAGNVSVAVSTSGGLSSNVSGGFTYAGTPTITMISPTSGLDIGNTLVTVTGTNFITGSTSVSIGGSAGTSVSVSSATSLTFRTPTHAAGAVTMSVTTPVGTSGTTGYTYTSSMCFGPGHICSSDAQCCSHTCDCTQCD